MLTHKSSAADGAPGARSIAVQHCGGTVGPTCSTGASEHVHVDRAATQTAPRCEGKQERRAEEEPSIFPRFDAVRGGTWANHRWYVGVPVGSPYAYAVPRKRGAHPRAAFMLHAHGSYAAARLKPSLITSPLHVRYRVAEQGPRGRRWGPAVGHTHESTGQGATRGPSTLVCAGRHLIVVHTASKTFNAPVCKATLSAR